jgi:hypothetical protein
MSCCSLVHVGLSPPFPCLIFPLSAQVTVLSQQVVLQELPVPRVQLPRNPTKPVERAAAVARSVLQKQRRVQLLLGPDQIDRLSSMMAKVMEAAPAPPEEQQPQRPGGEQDNQKKPGRQGRASRGGPEKRSEWLWQRVCGSTVCRSLRMGLGTTDMLLTATRHSTSAACHCEACQGHVQQLVHCTVCVSLTHTGIKLLYGLLPEKQQPAFRGLNT